MTTFKPNPNKLTNALLYLSFAILLFGAGFKYGEWRTLNGARGQGNYTIFNSEVPQSRIKNAKNVDFSLFWDTWEKVQAKYVDEKKVDTQKMFYGAIKGMVASVGDPYTFFLTPDENTQSKNSLGGKFEGIGAQLGLKDNRVIVIAPINGSPAKRAGIQAGDYIVKVDGVSTLNLTLAETVGKIRGKGGTKVSITINRQGEEKTMNLIREEIKVSSVELSFETRNGNKAAYLKLSQFGDTTNEEWDKAVTEIEEKWKNKEIIGMVLDLRDNPGGYLESAVHLASEFIDYGDVVVKQETSTAGDKVYTAYREGRLKGIKLVVLINGGSASAAEILSGALRDHKKATLIGQKSFGKGSVQEPIDLTGGAGLHVTIAKWLLPKGEWINGKGIEPKIKSENKFVEGNTITKETDVVIQTAIDTLAK